MKFIERVRNCDIVFIAVLLILCALIRIALIWPLTEYAKFTDEHYNLITDHVLLHNGTYDTTIEAGEKIAAKWGPISLFWDVSLFLPCLCILPPLNLALLVVDMTVTIFLGRATYYQTAYNPHYKAACNPTRNPNIRNFLRPLGTNESFFEAAARLNDTVTTPTIMCERFVKEWTFGIVVSFLYACISLLSLIAFFGSLKEPRKSSKRAIGLLKEVFDFFMECLETVPRISIICIAYIVYFIPQELFRCLPRSVEVPVRKGRRNVIKAGLGLEQTTEMKMADLRKKSNNRHTEKRRYRGGEGTNSPLADFLGIYDMLMLVTENLHYIDVLNLSRVSKSVRASVLPAQDFDRRISIFKTYTCQSAGKTCCWTCANQVCTDCQQMRQIRQTTLMHHLERCEPYCTPCYNAHVMNRPQVRFTCPFCTCGFIWTEQNVFVRYMKVRKHFVSTRRGRGDPPRALCRECNCFNAAELLAMREQRTKRYLREGRRDVDKQVWTRCARDGCGRALGSGPRWWVHNKDTEPMGSRRGYSACKKECRSWVHQAWGSKASKKVDDGGDAV